MNFIRFEYKNPKDKYERNNSIYSVQLDVDEYIEKSTLKSLISTVDAMVKNNIPEPFVLSNVKKFELSSSVSSGVRIVEEYEIRNDKIFKTYEIDRAMFKDDCAGGVKSIW